MNYSVIIPARNEENNLPSCISSLRNSLNFAETKLAKKLNLEIIVVCNRCKDNTEKVALELGAKVIKSEAKNLSVIRNKGASIANAKRLITIDADSLVSKNMFFKIHQKMKNPKVFGGGVVIFPERWSLGILLSGFALLPFALKERIAAGLFFIRKDVFDKIGGFDENYFSAEDVDFAKRIKAYSNKNSGKFTILWNAYIITSCRKFDKFGDYYILRQLPDFYKLLRGQKSKLADELWYDYEQDI